MPKLRRTFPPDHTFHIYRICGSADFEAPEFLCDTFIIPPIDKLYLAWKSQSTDFKALKSWRGRKGCKNAWSGKVYIMNILFDTLFLRFEILPITSWPTLSHCKNLKIHRLTVPLGIKPVDQRIYRLQNHEIVVQEFCRLRTRWFTHFKSLTKMAIFWFICRLTNSLCSLEALMEGVGRVVKMHDQARYIMNILI